MGIDPIVKSTKNHDAQMMQTTAPPKALPGVGRIYLGTLVYAGCKSYWCRLGVVIIVCETCATTSVLTSFLIKNEKLKRPILKAQCHGATAHPKR